MYILSGEGNIMHAQQASRRAVTEPGKASFIQQMQNSTSSCCAHPTSEMCKGAQMRTLQLAGRMNEG